MKSLTNYAWEWSLFDDLSVGDCSFWLFKCGRLQFLTIYPWELSALAPGSYEKETLENHGLAQAIRNVHNHCVISVSCHLKVCCRVGISVEFYRYADINLSRPIVSADILALITEYLSYVTQPRNKWGSIWDRVPWVPSPPQHDDIMLRGYQFLHPTYMCSWS